MKLQGPNPWYQQRVAGPNIYKEIYMNQTEETKNKYSDKFKLRMLQLTFRISVRGLF